MMVIYIYSMIIINIIIMSIYLQLYLYIYILKMYIRCISISSVFYLLQALCVYICNIL